MSLQRQNRRAKKIKTWKKFLHEVEMVFFVAAAATVVFKCDKDTDKFFKDGIAELVGCVTVHVLVVFDSSAKKDEKNE